MKDFLSHWLKQVVGARSSAVVRKEADALEAPSLEPSINWQAELLLELNIQAGQQGVAAEPGFKRYSSAQGFKPGSVPEDFESYRALLHHVFDPARQRLAHAVAQEPLCLAAFDGWRPGNLQGNLNILYLLFEKLSSLIGPIYRFHPAPLGYAPGLGDASGQYDGKFRRIMLSERLLQDPIEECFATIIHEQIHKLQHEMILRLDFPSHQPLSLEERALAYYWVREQPRVKHFYTRAWNDIKEGRGDAAYRRIGKEYHAFDTEEYVVSHLARQRGHAGK
jgi:hypothetical protein